MVWKEKGTQLSAVAPVVIPATDCHLWTSGSFQALVFGQNQRFAEGKETTYRAKWGSGNLCQTGKYVPQRRGTLYPIPPSQEIVVVANPFRTYNFSRVINLHFYLKHPHFKILHLVISKHSESQTENNFQVTGSLSMASWQPLTIVMAVILRQGVVS